jgi:hypothetical protein
MWTWVPARNLVSPQPRAPGDERAKSTAPSCTACTSRFTKADAKILLRRSGLAARSLRQPTSLHRRTPLHSGPTRRVRVCTQRNGEGAIIMARLRARRAGHVRRGQVRAATGRIRTSRAYRVQRHSAALAAGRISTGAAPEARPYPGIPVLHHIGLFLPCCYFSCSARREHQTIRGWTPEFRTVFAIGFLGAAVAAGTEPTSTPYCVLSWAASLVALR